MRYAFLLSTSPVVWGATSLLSFEWQPKLLKSALEAFVRRVRIELPGMRYSWWMESQKRGVVHFHFLWDSEWLRERGWLDERHITTVGRNKKQRTVLRGPLDDFVSATWVRVVGNPSSRFAGFQNGGTTEPVRDSSSLAVYPILEAGKPAQKKIPKGFTTPGRWWYLHPKAYAEQAREFQITEWPFPYPAKYVFDAKQLYGVSWDYVDEARLLPDNPAGVRDDIPF